MSKPKEEAGQLVQLSEIEILLTKRTIRASVGCRLEWDGNWILITRGGGPTRRLSPMGVLITPKGQK